MSLLEHLDELRSRVFRVAVAYGIALCVCWVVSDRILKFLLAPVRKSLLDAGEIVFLTPTEPFFVYMQAAAVAALFAVMPYLLHQVWAFVAPGLYRHEKRLALPVLVSSFVFFLIGMAFAYFFVFPTAFGFFASYTPAGVTMMTDIDKYLSFVLTMFIAFGLTFETPVVVVVLVRMRVVSLEKLRSMRPYVIVGAFVIGAVFTPPDVISQCLLAIPLWVLYELGLQLERLVGAPAAEAGEETTEPAK